MKTKDIPAETMKRIEGLEKKKADDLAAISERIQESERALEDAEREIKSATERTDLTAYQAAKQKEADATAAIEMYSARYTQLESKSFVTRKESEATIDNLFKYEKDIEAEFIEAIAEPLARLKAIHKEYTDGVRAAERAIAEWTRRIKPNYRSATAIYADGTNISPVPVPVRNVPYNGSDDAELVGRFLDKASKLIGKDQDTQKK